MKKRILLTATLAFGLFAAQANAATMQVTVDGKAIAFNTEPVVKQNVTMVQFAPIFRSLGISFAWNQKQQQVTAIKNDTRMILTVGSRTAYINGRAVRMQQAPVSINGNIFVPLRFVSEATGARVDLSGNRIAIASTSGSSVTPATVPASGSDDNAKQAASESAITDYLYAHYDTLYTPDTGYEVDYETFVDEDGDYNVTVLLDNFEASGTLYAETKSDSDVLLDFTGDFATDLAETFDLDLLVVHIALAPVLDEIPAGLSEDDVYALDNGKWMLLQPIFGGIYDFSQRYAEFYDLTVDESDPIASAEW
ncbi:copper amine oxidase N-terminal domain-containing protein [Saccharibacillus sacchari]|uniref:Copper amine oxidase N-terminal domain-containing protein n=1 Tax=Saccharibacillus sacchari TaxID=456493 RepID=A0ACC6PCB8_9BACL